MIFNNSFLHFFDSTFIEERLNGMNRMALREIESALILSLLFSERTYIPISSYIESEYCRSIIDKYNSMFDLGIITFVGGDNNLSEYVDEKMIQYPKGTFLGETYRHFEKKKLVLPYKEKKGSSTSHIKNEWGAKLNDFDEIITIFQPYFSQKKIDELAKNWESVPERLEKTAFIVKHVIPLLDKKIESNIKIKNQLHKVINSAYFRHYIQTLKSAIITDMVYLDSEEVNSLAIYSISYRAIMEIIKSNPTRYKHLLSHDANSLIKNRQSELIKEIYINSLQIKEKQSKNLKDIHDKYIIYMKNNITIGIITALPEEFTAMRLMIQEESVPPRIEGDPNDYKMGIIKTLNGEDVKIILALAKEMGTNQAANVTTNLIRSYPEIRQIIMVGIAGGIPDLGNPDKHIRLGDIVAIDNEGLLQYDNLKIDSKKIKIRDKSDKPSALFIGKTRIIFSDIAFGKAPWTKYIDAGINRIPDGKRPDSSTDILRVKGVVVEHPIDPKRKVDLPKVHVGKIGCSNTLLKNEELRDKLRDEHGVRAIEMESSGVADGTWTCAREYFVVRGIVDYCNDDKNDEWHQYSAICAAAFTKCLIENI